MTDTEGRRPVGDTVDKLGVKLLMDDSDMITDVVVIAKVVEANGEVRCGTTWSEGMSWIERVGLLTVAKAADMPTPEDRRDV